MASGPTIIEQSSAAAIEATKAKLWRKNVVKLTRKELGKRTGYSVQAIQLFERGYNYAGAPLKARTWTRYRLVCAGLHVPQFDWSEPTTNGSET